MAMAVVSHFSCSDLQLAYLSAPPRAVRTHAVAAVPFKTLANFSSGSSWMKQWSLFKDVSFRFGDKTKAALPDAVPVQVEDWVKRAREDRIAHLEEQALWVLRETVNNYQSPAFPCALIAGDVVILDLLNKLGFLSNGRVKVIFVDTFHLFPETYSFLELLEKRYGFKAQVFHAAGVSNKKEYSEKHGSDLFIRDIDEYDRICKVEPFNRSLDTLEVDAMINGRRRDHGAERAHLEVVEGGARAKVQPLAYWEFRDVWNYLEKYGVPYHPLHDQGYPSIGDVQSTLPVPKDQWFEYGGERSGRFQGLKNKDGSEKTECGIHVGSSQ